MKERILPTLSNKYLYGREFGGACLSVTDFFNWLNRRQLRIDTYPELVTHDFVQIEYLLVAVERAASKITNEEAEQIVSADPFLAGDPMAELSPAWLVGAEAHKRWRKLINDAMAKGELVPLDAVSKLPIAPPKPAQIIKPIQASAAQDAAILNAIRGLGLDPKQLKREPAGKRTVKADVKDLLAGETRIFSSGNVFDTAWQRLRDSDDIKNV